MDKEKLINKVAHDSNEIFTRLFDHRPFLNGELQHFVREFEEKKGNKDLEALLKSREKLTELNDVLSTLDKSHIEDSLGQLIQSVKDTTKALESAAVPKALVDTSEIERKEAERKAKWQSFLEQNTADLAALDNILKQKETELRKHYEELEEKLKTTIP